MRTDSNRKPEDIVIIVIVNVVVKMSNKRKCENNTYAVRDDVHSEWRKFLQNFSVVVVVVDSSEQTNEWSTLSFVLY